MKICEQIAKIMADCPAIGKDSKNAIQGFKYRGIDAIYNALQPIFTKHKVFSAPEVLEERSQRNQTKSGGYMNHSYLRIKYNFYADDGSTISATVISEAMDAGDKASNKAMAVAHKYAITQILKIPFQSDDPDADSPRTTDDYIIPFGKYKGQTIKETGVEDCNSYASYLYNESRKPDAKPVSENVKEFFAEVKKAKAT